MCGIAGLLDRRARSGDRLLRSTVEAMGGALRHRGPDSGGSWCDEASGIALAHRRLAIIDTSSAGHQPMASADGRHLVSFNGEIYNHLDLRRRLEAAGQAPSWRGHSDTETILAAVSAWGVRETLARLRGMFAIGLWDRLERRLWLARDRVGEKPLYYGWLGDTFVFASELKALRRHPAWTTAIDRGALTLFMRHGYVPAPHCIQAGLSKLPPGHLLCFDERGSQPVIETYWSARDTIGEAAQDPFTGTPDEAVDGLHDRLSASVSEQMMADVPLGAFLSGGIDSATIVALMQANSSRPVRTYTIGFHEEAFNEAIRAKAIAAHLGTAHSEHYVSSREALDTVGSLPELYDEPFADPSQLPTFLLARLTARDVTVALSGDGGDELFGGYERYARTEALMRSVDGLPCLVRNAVMTGINALPADAWSTLLRPMLHLARHGGRHAEPGQKLRKWADFLKLDQAGTYRHLMSSTLAPADLVIGGWEPSTPFTDPGQQYRGGDMQAFMMALDLAVYLPDDILVKVDRAAMGVSLETRIPMLDPRVIRYAWSLPQAFKVRDGQTKWVLRQVLHRHVPPALVEGPKRGFGVPVAEWLRGPLRPWATSLLDARRLRHEGMLDPSRVARCWESLMAGDDDAAMALWNVLMFQTWLQASHAGPVSACA